MKNVAGVGMERAEADRVLAAVHLVGAIEPDARRGPRPRHQEGHVRLRAGSTDLLIRLSGYDRLSDMPIIGISDRPIRYFDITFCIGISADKIHIGR